MHRTTAPRPRIARSAGSLGALALAALVAAAFGACSETSDGATVGDATGGGDTAALDGVVGADAELDAIASEVDGGDAADATAVTDTASPPHDATSTACLPGAYECATQTSIQRCRPDGSGFEPPTECPAEEVCRWGRCNVRCPHDPKFGVYVGCEFWATDLPNYPDPTLNPTPEDLPWAVVVSNPGEMELRVGFEMPPLFSFTPTDDRVPAGEARVFQMPNINVQGTSLRPKGVFVTTTGPATVHMFNPWDNRFSNDASLLLPEPMLGDDHVILSWPTSPLSLIEIPGFTPPPNQNGYFTVIAAYDNTDVTIQVTGPVKQSGPIPAMQPGQIFNQRMNRGDVLSIQTDPESLFETADLTGSRVSANRPIAVFGGHEQAVIGRTQPRQPGEQGSGSCCADHLESQMLPGHLLGDRYFAIKSPPRGTTQIEPDHWRIQAFDPGVVVTTNPPQVDAVNRTIAQKGGWFEIATNQSFEIIATGRIQVGQYLVSQAHTQAFTGDPSLVVIVAEERFRKDYAFMTPEGYSRLAVSIVKPAGVAVTIDGQPATGPFNALGGSGWEYGYAELTPGVHTASAASPFGLVVYGYNNAVSFAYIAGLASPGD